MERLTPLSAAFLQAEDEDPTAAMAIASCAIFEGPVPAQDEFVAHIIGRLPLVPRFRQRVRSVPLDLGAPVWVDDADIDPTWHIRRTAIPSPGGPEELHRLIGRVMSQRMDRQRPLWEYWVVEGLAGGRFAILQKVHHSMVDGVSGTELYHVMFDATPERRPPMPDTWVPTPEPSTLELTLDALRELVAAPVTTVRQVAAVVTAPRTLARRALTTAQGAWALTMSTLPVSSTSLSGQIGRQRRYTSVSVAFDDIRAIRAAFGGTVNDVALAAVSSGLRDLLLARGEEPTEHAVRTLVPVSARMPGDEGIPDNRVTLMLPYLPVEIGDPVERLGEVHRRIADAAGAHEPEAGATFTSLAGIGPYLPIALGIRMSFHVPQRQLVTVTTNVPGPREPVYALGRRCEEILPFVCIADRMRIGIAIFSYVDRIVFGVTADYDTVRDVDALATGITRGVDDLVARAHDERRATDPTRQGV